MRLSHYRQYVPRLQQNRLSPHIIRVVHSTGGVIHSYWCLVKHPSFSNHSRFIYDLVSQWRNIHIPPLALCCRVTLKDDRVTTLYTPWTTPSVTMARNSYAHAWNHLRMLTVPNSEAEILNILKHP